MKVISAIFAMLAVAMLGYASYDVIARAEYTNIDLLILALSSVLISAVAQPYSKG